MAAELTLSRLLQLLDWPREQRTFAGIDALKAWIAQDVRQTLARQRDDPSRPIGALPQVGNNV